MDAQRLKAPVPIERLAAQLRLARSQLRALQTGASGSDPALVAAVHRYRSLLAAAAEMLEVPAPRARFVPAGDAAEWSDVEEALARAGLDVAGRCA